MIREFLRALFGPGSEPSDTRRTRDELGRKLRVHADDWRQARARGRELREAIELLDVELLVWRRRLAEARECFDDAELVEVSAERVGWYAGQIDGARRELDRMHRQELFAHECLDATRGLFLDLVASARARGYQVDDFGLAAIYDDAPTAPVMLPDDDHGEFVGRIIDRMRKSVSR